MHEGVDRSRYSDLVVEALYQNGKLNRKMMDHAVGIPVADEEAGLAALDPQIGSVTLVRSRERVVAAFQALVHDAFDRHALPTDTGLDVGSGASGYMVNQLLPRDAQSKWLQMEVNPDAARMNREANPGKQVIVGSYLKLEQQGVKNMLKMVTGLSSLDATAHIDLAVAQIVQSLQVGGHLLHVQDTRPGIAGVHQELRHRGAKPPYEVVYMTDKATKPNDVLLYRDALATLDVIELFRRRIGRAIEGNENLQLLENTWMTAVGPGTNLGMNKHSELGVMVGLEAQGRSIDTASAVITVAKRIK